MQYGTTMLIYFFKEGRKKIRAASHIRERRKEICIKVRSKTENNQWTCTNTLYLDYLDSNTIFFSTK